MSVPVPPNGPNSGPFVQAFLIAERVDRPTPEQPDTPLAVFGLRFAAVLVGPTPEMPPNTPVRFALCLLLVGGPEKDGWAIEIRARHPTGADTFIFSCTLPKTPGEDGGGLIPGEFNALVSTPGLYWFDLFVDGVLTSRAPLMVSYQQRPASDRAPLN